MLKIFCKKAVEIPKEYYRIIRSTLLLGNVKIEKELCAIAPRKGFASKYEWSNLKVTIPQYINNSIYQLSCSYPQDIVWFNSYFHS